MHSAIYGAMYTRKNSRINNILEVLKQSAISSVDYVSSQKPFFRYDTNSQPFQQFNTLFIVKFQKV